MYFARVHDDPLPAIEPPALEPPASVPPIDAAIARRVESADSGYMVARLESLAAVADNAFGVAIHRVGDAFVLRASRSSSSMFNRILLGDDALLPRLDQAIALGGGPMAAGRVDVVPPLPVERLVRALARRGFACTGHYSALYGLAQTVQRPRRFAGRVRPMEAAELDAWLDIYVRAFGFKPDAARPLVASLRGLVQRPDTDLMVAELDGRPAAIAALWTEGRMGYLAVAATLPQARGQGCQSALIDARIERAAERGCDLIAGHAAVGSPSQRNMELAGLRLAFHKGLWTRPPA
jgi:GNAT superfamily N-acetyltransferase